MVENTWFYIPEDLYSKIMTGELKRFGGVVRNSKGEIVALLQETGQTTSLASLGISPTALAVVAVAAVGFGVYVKKRFDNIEKELKNVSEQIKGLQENICEISQRLDCTIISELQTADETIFRRIPKTRDNNERIRLLKQVTDSLQKLRNDLRNLIGLLVQKADIWKSSEIKGLFSWIECYLYTEELYYKALIAQKEYEVAEDAAHRCFEFYGENVVKKFQERCNADKEFVGLGGWSRGIKERQSILQEGFAWMETRALRIKYYQEKNISVEEAENISLKQLPENMPFLYVPLKVGSDNEAGLMKYCMQI